MNKLFISLLFVSGFFLVAGCSDSEETITSKEKELETTEEIKKTQPKEVVTKFDWYVTFKEYGLNEEQIHSIEEILTKVGFTEIKLMQNNYDDCSKGLCAFRSKVYDSDNLQLNFTLDNGELFYVALTGVPNLAKKIDSTSSIVLYQSNEGGYINIYNHQGNEITSY